MTDKITLTNLVNLTNQTTAVNAINSNNAVLTTAFDNTLSRDGTAPNQMGANLDMNNNQIINLPAPISTSSPLRIADATTLNGGGTVVLPATVVAGTNIAVSGNNPTTISTIASPTFTTLNVGTGLPTGLFAGAVHVDTNENVIFDDNGTTPQIRAVNDANSVETPFTVHGNPLILTSQAGSGVSILGTTGANNAGAGNVGEYVFSDILTGSSISLSNGTAANVTSISLTAGDCDVWGTVAFKPGNTTNITYLSSSTFTTSATLSIPSTGGLTALSYPAGVPTAITDPDYALTVPAFRFNVSSTTTVFLIAFAGFTVSTLSAYGSIRARRIR